MKRPIIFTAVAATLGASAWLAVPSQASYTGCIAGLTNKTYSVNIQPGTVVQSTTQQFTVTVCNESPPLTQPLGAMEVQVPSSAWSITSATNGQLENNGTEALFTNLNIPPGGNTATVTFTAKTPSATGQYTWNFFADQSNNVNPGDPGSPGNNFILDGAHSSTQTIVRAHQATFAVSLSGSPSQVGWPGGSVTYTAHVTNQGPDASAASLTDTLSGDATFSHVPSGCSGAGTKISTCSVATLAPNTSTDLAFTATTGSNPTTCGGSSGHAVCDSVSVQGQYETVTHTAGPVVTSVVDQADLGVSFGDSSAGIPGSNPGTTQSGNTIAYTVQVTNHGPQPAPGSASAPSATITETAAGGSFATNPEVSQPSGSTINSGWSCPASVPSGTTSVTCSYSGSLAAGAHTTDLQLAVVADNSSVTCGASSGAGVCDTASITAASMPDQNTANNSASQFTAVSPATCASNPNSGVDGNDTSCGTGVIDYSKTSIVTTGSNTLSNGGTATSVGTITFPATGAAGSQLYTLDDLLHPPLACPVNGVLAQCSFSLDLHQVPSPYASTGATLDITCDVSKCPGGSPSGSGPTPLVFGQANNCGPNNAPESGACQPTTIPPCTSGTQAPPGSSDPICFGNVSYDAQANLHLTVYNITARDYWVHGYQVTGNCVPNTPCTVLS